MASVLHSRLGSALTVGSGLVVVLLESGTGLLDLRLARVLFPDLEVRVLESYY